MAKMGLEASEVGASPQTREVNLRVSSATYREGIT